MPLKGIPDTITPELLYALAKMGHGDMLCIADANFPSDSTARSTVVPTPIRVHGSTADILRDILTLVSLDEYASSAICVMDRVQSDKDRGLEVPAYALLAHTAAVDKSSGMTYMDRYEFYEKAKLCFVIIQTDDRSLYANCIISKGVL